MRDAIDAMIDALGVGADPSAVLAEHGYGDLPPDTFSSALVHFADRAPLDVADALAPIVTRVSPVPFEAEDLPPSEADDLLDGGADVFDLLANVGLSDLDDPEEADPSLFDGGDADQAVPLVEPSAEPELDAPVDDELTPTDGTEPGTIPADDDDDGGESGEPGEPTFGHGEADDDTDVEELFASDPFGDVDLESDEAFVPTEDDNEIWGREDGQAAAAITESLIDGAEHADHILDHFTDHDDPADFDADLD
jgi:hypothetical protein